MTIIANPIYDAVFKFLMEDKKVAKILLSEFLKKVYEYRQPGGTLLLEINEEHLDEEVKYVLHRLHEAAKNHYVRSAMEIEDEVLSKIEDRDTTIMLKDKDVEEKDKEIEQLDKEIEQLDKKLEQLDQVIEEKDQMIRSMVKLLCNSGASIDEISRQLSIPVEQIKKYINS